MKTLKLLTLCIITAFILFACGASVENTPEAVAEAFIKALNELNFSEAKKHCTEEGAEALETLELFMTDEMKEEAKAQQKDADQTIKITNVNESGDSATVEYSVGGMDQAPLELAKVDGNWKVNFQKEM
jgi:hypothetical protein